MRHLATDVQNGEEEFKNSFQRSKSSKTRKKKESFNKNISNNSFNNTTSFSRTMNNFNHPNINMVDNSNNQQNMSKTNPRLENNQLENSSSSIGSNINPMNSFSSENLNRHPGAGCVQGAINCAPTCIPNTMTVRRQQCLLASMAYLGEMGSVKPALT